MVNRYSEKVILGITMDQTDSKLLTLLEGGVNQVGLSLSSPQLEKLLLFIDLIAKWNKVHNLTAINNKKDMVVYHLLDSMVAVPFMQNYETVLDVGTGAGIPGIPLAIAMPNTKFTLVDSRSKRVKFVQFAIRSLQLSNVEVIHSRIEDFNQDKFSVITSRAFSSLSNFVNLSKHLVADSGAILAYKGDDSTVSQEELPEGFSLSKIHRVSVPHLEAKRCLVLVNKD